MGGAVDSHHHDQTHRHAAGPRASAGGPVMRAALGLIVGMVLLGACASSEPPVAVERMARGDILNATLPAMKTFSKVRPSPSTRSNADIARDFLDLSFRLESGRELPVLTRFEGPVTIRTRGPEAPRLSAD